MGKYFNQNLKHANFWRKRTKEELMMTEIRARRGASNAPKHAGGRPKLNIDPNEVLRSVSAGKSLSAIGREFGVHGKTIRRIID